MPAVRVLLEVECREEIKTNRRGRWRGAGGDKVGQKRNTGASRRTPRHDDKQDALFCGPPTVPFVLCPPRKRCVPTSEKCESSPVFSSRHSPSLAQIGTPTWSQHDRPLKRVPLAGSPTKTLVARRETTASTSALHSRPEGEYHPPSLAGRVQFAILVSTDAFFVLQHRLPSAHRARPVTSTDVQPQVRLMPCKRSRAGVLVTY